MNDYDLKEPHQDVLHGLSHPGSSGENGAGDSDGRGSPGKGTSLWHMSGYHPESLQGHSKQELMYWHRLRLSEATGCSPREPCQQVGEQAAEGERLQTANQWLFGKEMRQETKRAAVTRKSQPQK